MKQKEKELLLKDLCARLPYGVMLNTPNGNKPLLALAFSKTYNTIVEYNDYHGDENNTSEWEGGDIEFVKPYLRPMSSMTEEEKKQFKELTYDGHEDFETTTGRRMILATDSDTGYGSEYFSEDISEVVDWLNTHHIDYRGLIEKGLALEAPSDMYNN